MTTHVFVHNEADSVGVVVTERVEAGTVLQGWVIDTGKTMVIEARQSIPLGHKIALRDIEAGETVIEYGQDIGRATERIPRGYLVHVHNLKSKRW